MTPPCSALVCVSGAVNYQAHRGPQVSTEAALLPPALSHLVAWRAGCCGCAAARCRAAGCRERPALSLRARDLRTAIRSALSWRRARVSACSMCALMGPLYALVREIPHPIRAATEPTATSNRIPGSSPPDRPPEYQRLAPYIGHAPLCAPSDADAKDSGDRRR